MSESLAPTPQDAVADKNSFDATAGENAAALGWLIATESSDAND